MPRTQQEIEKEMQTAKEFVKQHPYSMFGTDNNKHLRLFEKVIEKFSQGQSCSMLEDFVDAYDDEDYAFCYDVVEWLFADEYTELW